MLTVGGYVEDQYQAEKFYFHAIELNKNQKNFQTCSEKSQIFD